jgi:uncharacterized protein
VARLTLVLCIVTVIASHAQHTIKTIPNNRPINNSRVSNPDTVLSARAVSELDALLVAIEDTTTVQIAVVAVRSIGDADVFDFAHELFNTWGIGHANDNGVLVLLVTDQRTVRTHTGGGVQGILTDVTCKRIQQQYMVPRFAAGDYDGGMLAGVNRMNDFLIDPSKRSELAYVEGASTPGYLGWVILVATAYGLPFLCVWGYRASMGRFADSKKPTQVMYKAARPNQRTWVILFGLIPHVIVLAFWPGSTPDTPLLCFWVLYFYFMATLVYRLVRERRLLNQFMAQGRYYDATQYIGNTTMFWFFMALIFPIPFALYFLFHLTRKSHYRNHPRTCKLCNTGMKKLSEREEDEYLDDRQQFEEKIAAVDYDVWLCPSCKATREWHYVKVNDKYEKCPSCKTQAYYKKSKRTVASATYSKAGEGKEVFECKYCNESVTKTFMIPMLVSSSSSSDSSDSSSSSSSSGSDWGGGGSDGGGSSSSW